MVETKPIKRDYGSKVFRVTKDELEFIEKCKYPGELWSRCLHRIIGEKRGEYQNGAANN